MDRQTGFENREAYRGALLSIGNFDGVHRGHQRIISTLVAAARKIDRPAVVMTFDPHPIRILAPDRAPPQLSSLDRKAELLEDLGVDCLIAMPTDRTLLDLSPDDFFSRIIRDEIAAAGLIEGENFCFGRDRAGTVETLRRLCRDAGISLTVVDHVALNGDVVSSSAIRRAVTEGRLSDAVSMLGHLYRLRGRVVAGAGRGSAIGFPTANLADVETLLPADGVYAGVGHVGEARYAAAVHRGGNPTFGDAERKLEVHLIDYSGGPLYDQEIAVDLMDRVRGTVEFASPDALRDQLTADIARVREIVTRQERE